MKKLWLTIKQVLVNVFAEENYSYYDEERPLMAYAKTKEEFEIYSEFYDNMRKIEEATMRLNKKLN